MKEKIISLKSDFLIFSEALSADDSFLSGSNIAASGKKL